MCLLFTGDRGARPVEIFSLKLCVLIPTYDVNTGMLRIFRKTDNRPPARIVAPRLIALPLGWKVAAVSPLVWSEVKSFMSLLAICEPRKVPIHRATLIEV